VGPSSANACGWESVSKDLTVLRSSFVSATLMASSTAMLTGSLLINLWQYIYSKKLSMVIHQGRIYGTGMPVLLHVFLLEPGANDPAGLLQVKLK
jgi:hypothetical protein